MPAAVPYKGKDTRPADDGGALRGATLAFGAKPTVKPKSVTKNYSGTNGALAAAMKVGSTHLQPPQSSRSNLDSRIAANLAASRSPTISPMNTGQSVLLPPGPSSIYSQISAVPSRSPSESSNASREYGTRQQGSLNVKQVQKKKKILSVDQNSRDALDQNESREHRLDTTPIPPTNKLISIFEDKSPPLDMPPEQSTRPSLHLNTTDMGSQNSSLVSKSQVKGRSLKPTPKSPKPAAYRVSTPGPNLDRHDSIRARPRQSSEYDDTKQKELSPSSNDSFVSASDFKENETQDIVPSPRKAPKPIPPPLRRNTAREKSSDDRGRRASMEYHGAYIPHLSDTSHFNAITASSLASSRAGSPVSFAPPIPPPKPNKHSLFRQTRLQDSRTPSPAKQPGFRKTMRDPNAKEKEEYEEEREKKGRKKLLHKHPNKHAEGDRRRWRDAITERERKRYEAVWASNKGLFIQSPVPIIKPLLSHINDLEDPKNTNKPPTLNSSDLVSNISVRDIWRRSRLADDVLEEIWDLVCQTTSHALAREEFVVGLWLIDQRLRGRKLPVKVGVSVWGSAGRIPGVRGK